MIEDDGCHSQRIVFVGINSLYSTAHLHSVNQAYKVAMVVETVGPVSWLKKLQRRLVGSRLAKAARAAGVPFVEVPHRDTAALTDILLAVRPDLVVIAGMGWLLDEAALAVPVLGTLNVHPTLLPAYRGAEPLFWQLFDGITESGVTVHLVGPGEDSGPIISQQTFPLLPGISLSECIALVHQTGPPLLVDAIGAVLSGTHRPMSQPASSPTRRARRLRHDDRRLIAWDEWSLERTWRVLRGVGPILGWPKPRWRDLGRTPVIEVATREVSGVPAGQTGRDAQGYFLGHSNGKIRFRYHWSPQAWLAAMYRGDAVAGGIIAAEKAAWPPAAKIAVATGPAQYGRRDSF